MSYYLLIDYNSHRKSKQPYVLFSTADSRSFKCCIDMLSTVVWDFNMSITWLIVIRVVKKANKKALENVRCKK